MEQFGYYKVEDVEKYDVYCALILGKIDKWCEYHKKNDNKQSDGNYWSGHLSHQDFVDQTGLSYRTVRRKLKYLVENNIIQRGNFNDMSYDATGWYRRLPEGHGCPQRTEGGVLRGQGECPERTGGMSTEDATIPNIPIYSLKELSNIHNTGIYTGSNTLLKQLIEAENEHVQRAQVNYITKLVSKQPTNNEETKQYNDALEIIEMYPQLFNLE